MDSCISSTDTREVRHLLTVSVEDYFHVGAFESAIQRKHWGRFDSCVAKNIHTVLKLLEQHDVHATFFVLGWVAERQPDVVRAIAAAGHEIASSGYWSRGLKGIMPEEFREDLQRAKEVLEASGANKIVGYRSPRDWLRSENLWILDILAEEGYL